MKRAWPGVARTCLVSVLLLSLALNTYHLWWGLPLAGPVAWGTDEVAPMGPLVYAKRTFVDGAWFHKYPAFHFVLLSVAYAPFVAYLLVSGQFSAAVSDSWPYGFSDPASTLTNLVLIARLLSALMGAAIVGLIYLITQRLFGRSSGLFAAMIVAFCYPFIYYSHTSNLDVPYLFWFTLALLFYSRLFTKSRPLDYALLGVCLGLAVATKDQAYALLPLLPVPLVWFWLKARQGDQPGLGFSRLLRSLPWTRYAQALGVFALTYALAANVLNNWQGYLRHLEYITGPGSAPYQQFSHTVFGHVALLFRTISLLASSLNVPLFVVCAVGLLVCLIRYRAVTLALLAPAVSYYLFFLSVVLYVYPRFLLPLVLILAIFGGKLLDDLWAARRRASWVIRPAIALLVLYSFLYGASVDWLLQQDPRYRAEEWIARNVARAARVEAYGPAQYLPRFPAHVGVDRVELQGPVEEAFRQRTPDYVVLTWAYYRRIVDDDLDDFDQEEFIQHLWDGSLGYRAVADFEAPAFLSPDLIPGLNSRLTVFGQGQTVTSTTDVPR